MKKRIITLLLTLVLVISLIPDASARENPETGGYVKLYEAWGEYYGYHRYVALGQSHTVILNHYMGASNGGPRWKLYKIKLDGNESAEELAETAEKLIRQGKSFIDSGGSGIYNSSNVYLTKKIVIDADALGTGSYLVVGYNCYEKTNSYETQVDYETICAVAVHVQKEEQPIESIQYFKCKEDGTIVKELSLEDELTVYMARSDNDLEPTYLKVVPSPTNATEYVQLLYAIDLVKPGENYLTDSSTLGENFFFISGQSCGSGKMTVCVRDFADGAETRELHDVFSVNVPHLRDGQTRTLINPTCTDAGLQGAWCESHYKGCNYIFDEKILNAYGHSLDEQSIQIVSDHTATKPGLAVGHCNTCGLREAEQVIPAIFSDVMSDAFYSDALDYGYNAGWVSGLSTNTFGPNASCNRAQVVTFLWRVAGCPEPTVTENPFVDVQSGSFYEKAVLWAVENEITTGTDATHFSPNMTCNRATVVTFLYRAFEKPTMESVKNPFVDVPAESWYTIPVLWAVDNGITNGVSATEFAPNSNCNRAQVVTFLFRAYLD